MRGHVLAAHDPETRRRAARIASHARLARYSDAAARRNLTAAARLAKRQAERDAVLAEAAERGETPLSADEVEARMAEARRQRMAEIGRLGVEARQRKANAHPGWPPAAGPCPCGAAA